MSYDGQTVYFAMATPDDPFYHLYSIPVVGGPPKQLTSGAFHDCDPEPLPGGGLIFSSTRLGTREEYHSYQTTCLMTLSADGATIRPFSYHIVHDRMPRMTSAGDVVCVRQDNFLCNSKITTNIEFLRRNGQGAFVLLGQERGGCGYDPVQDSEGPPRGIGLLSNAELNYKRTGFMFGCPTPLPDGRVVCLRSRFGHGVNHKIDLALSGDSSEGRTIETSVPLHDIAALPDGRLLGATLDRKGLGVVDLPSGTVTVMYANTDIHSPVYAGPRPEPMPWPAEPPARDSAAATGFFFCHSVFATHEKNADLQRIRGVRVYKAVPFTMTSCSYITRADSPSGPHIGTEAVELGTVPLTAEGGFQIEVPADTPLAFQAVDGEGRAVISELSWVYVRPGERRSCVGCHAPRTGSPPPSASVAALNRPLKMDAETAPFRWKASSFKWSGVLGYQPERIRESKSINLYPWPETRDASDAIPLPPGRAETVRELTQQVNTGTPPQRISALRHLAVLHERTVTPALVGALQSDHPRVRLEAAQALAACGDFSALAPLAAQLEKDRDTYATLAIEQALRHLSGEQCRGAQAWRDRLSGVTRDTLANVLTERLARARDHQEVITTVQTLGHLGGESACAALRRWQPATIPSTHVWRPCSRWGGCEMPRRCR